jgi:putative tryptophan/tyrosine transport system substrate-binding protein
MRRRDCLTLLGGVSLAWPLAARAQQPGMPVIGFLNSTSSRQYADRAEAFREGLKDTRYVEGQNVVIEYRWAENQIDRLPALAADLAHRKVSVIAAGGSPASALAAKLATTSIPIVFMNAADPVQLGLVASLSRPGGNITGVTTVSTQLEAKRLGLLRELVPSATSIAVLVNPARPGVDAQSAQIKEAARALGLPLQILQASSEREFDTVFQAVREHQAGALAIAADAMFTAERDQIVALAKRYSVVTMYELREYVTAGGLISYGASGADTYRQAGNMVGRILKGEQPSDMPVLQPTKFELVINMKTAKAFGIAIPPGVLAIADEVIE